MAIKAEHINYVYGKGTAFEQHALKDVNLEIEAGEFVGLIGHTGSGKSTLIQHLNGLLRATDGKLYYNGRNIYEEGYDMRALRSHVGLVFQYPEHQLFEIDVYTDVCFGPKNQGLNKEEAGKRAKEALTMVGLDESYYKRSPFELSGGQKRRVAIAGVLAMNPDVLILDEPTRGIDVGAKYEIYTIINQLADSGKSIVVISSEMPELLGLCDRIYVVNEGEIAGELPRSEATRKAL